MSEEISGRLKKKKSVPTVRMFEGFMKPEETSLNLKASSPAQVNHQAPLLMRTKKTTKKKKIMGLNRWFQPLGLWDRS